eukprot:812507-Pyramimonas_sp.AAC.1
MVARLRKPPGPGFGGRPARPPLAKAAARMGSAGQPAESEAPALTPTRLRATRPLHVTAPICLRTSRKNNRRNGYS